MDIDVILVIVTVLLVVWMLDRLAEAGLRDQRRTKAPLNQQFRAIGQDVRATQTPAAWPSPEAVECAEVLIRHARADCAIAQVLSEQKLFDSVWKEAARRTHPDTNGGRDGADFNRVINARDRIKTLKGWL